MTRSEIDWLYATEHKKDQVFGNIFRGTFSDSFRQNLSIFTNTSVRAGYDTKSIFKRSFTGLNSEFSFSETSCLTKAEEPNIPYYLPIAGWIIIGFIPFARVLVQCEVPSVSSRIWICVTVSISYNRTYHRIRIIRVLAVNLLPDLGFSVFLLVLFTYSLA